jgi:phosphoglycerate dehydrogenase-like enzyme
MPDLLHLILHPVHGPGLVEALDGEPGLVVSVPTDGEGVVAELEAGATGLVTYQWEDRFAVGGIAWIQALSAGVDQFPLEMLAGQGIVLTSARGAHSPAVAEHAIALMLSVVRGVGHAVRGAVDRTWQPGRAHEVAGRTLGVLGLGSIGEAIAGKAAALGMRVIGTKRDPSSYAGVAEAVLPPSGTLDVCRQADVLVLSLPEDESTAGLIGSEELAALGSGWLVNVGRGTVVNEPALVRALTEGELRGAGLDVTSIEPLPDDSPLWDLEAVIITPHMAWSTDRLAGRIAELVIANARALRGEGDWVNRVI